MIQHVIKNCLNDKCGRREIHHKQTTHNPNGAGVKVTLTCVSCRHKETYILNESYPKPKELGDIA